MWFSPLPLHHDFLKRRQGCLSVIYRHYVYNIYIYTYYVALVGSLWATVLFWGWSWGCQVSTNVVFGATGSVETLR